MVQVSYPGVYIQELPSGVHTITGVATSITAFIGQAARGPVNEPVRVQSFGEFERVFGGLSMQSMLGYAVSHFFNNGGGDALIVRVANATAVAAKATAGAWSFEWASTGAYGNNVEVNVTQVSDVTKKFNLIITDFTSGTATSSENLTYTSSLTTPIKLTPNNASAPPAAISSVNLLGGTASTQAAAALGPLMLVAKNPGGDGNKLWVDITNASNGNSNYFNLIVTNQKSPGSVTVFENLVIFPTTDASYIGTKLSGLSSSPILLDSSMPPPTVNTPRPSNTTNPIRLSGGADAAGSASLSYSGLTLTAANPGSWGNNLRMRIESAPNSQFNLIVRDTATGATETFLNLSVNPLDARFVTDVVAQGSNLVTITAVPSALSTFHPAPAAGADIWDTTAATSTGVTTNTGADGLPISEAEISDPSLEGSKKGIWALEKADLFNLLCIPPMADSNGNILEFTSTTRTKATQYCKKRRALYIVDPISTWVDAAAAASGLISSFITRDANAALFFPYIIAPDPLRGNQLSEFAPCGAVAGVMARTDGERGVWKAPAGITATLNGVSDLTVKLTDGENGQLNPIAVNCLRSFPIIGNVVWGARTLNGADQLADQWKYIPIRRLALFLEESLFRGTKWVVFEPNDEPLWAKIRLNVGAFMMSQFKQGAFQGANPKDAFFVKCDGETTTENDRNLGIVNIIVGFAPLKPAEFVVISIQQIAGNP